MFSIGDDELDVDLDDEEFLLAACGIPPSTSNNIAQVPNISSNTTAVHNNPCFSTNDSRIPLNSLTNSCSSIDNRRTVPSCRNDINTKQQNGSSNTNSVSNKVLQTFTNRTNVNGQKNKSPEQVSGPPLKKIALQSGGNSRNTHDRCNNAFNNCNSQLKYVNNNINSRSSPSLSTSNKNSFFSVRDNSQLNSPGSSTASGAAKNSGTFTSPVARSPDIFQTPNRTNQNLIDSFNPRGSSNSGSCDVVDVTPSRRKSARKFPGPAGLLPKLNSSQSLDELSVKQSPVQLSSRVSPKNMQPPVCSQSQISSEDEEFTRDPWIGMYNEYTQNVPALMRYTICQVISEAAGHRLKHGKVPSLCVLVKTSSPTETDTSILLKDATGEIHGTLHKKVLEEYPSQLGPGAGIILKQVSVFSPSTRKHYLNITPGNIIHIYPPDPSHVSCSQLLASQGTQVAKSSSQQRVLVDEHEIILDDVPCNQEKEPIREEREDQENFSDLLAGLDQEDDILDEDLLAMY